jgi:hypothetical protein
VIADDGHVICEEKPPHAAASAAASAETTSAPAVAAGAEATATVGAPDAAAGLPTPTGKAARRLAALQAGPPGATLRLPRLAVDGRVVAGTMLASKSLRAALPVVAGLPHALRETLAVVEVTREGQLTLRFDAGPAVVWGLAGRTLAKTLALRVVLERYQKASQDCLFVDVSTPDRVLARPVLK